MESTNSASVTVAKSAEACVSCSNFSKMSCGRVKRTLRGELSGLISNLTTQLISHDSGSCDNSHDWQTPRLSKVRGSWFLEATDFCNPQGRQIHRCIFAPVTSVNAHYYSVLTTPFDMVNAHYVIIDFRAKFFIKIQNQASDTSRSLPSFSSAPFLLRAVPSERLGQV
jgi:hypothetical protein